jgi:hypothetical protein
MSAVTTDASPLMISDKEIDAGAKALVRYALGTFEALGLGLIENDAKGDQ